MLYYEIDYCNQNNVQPDDEQCADGYIGDDRSTEAVEHLATI